MTKQRVRGCDAMASVVNISTAQYRQPHPFTLANYLDQHTSSTMRFPMAARLTTSSDKLALATAMGMP